MTEQWKLVEPDDLCSYEVSNLGRVRIAVGRKHTKGRFKAGHVMTPNLQNAGYLVVWLRRGGKSKIQLVHRLVASAFCGPAGDEVNHKDGNKRNNRADNLEWVTRKQNVDHSVASGFRREIFTPADRARIRHLYAEHKLTQRQIGKLYGVSDVMISYILTGRAYPRDKTITKPSNRSRKNRQQKPNK